MTPDEAHAAYFKDKPDGFHPDGKPSRETIDRLNVLEVKLMTQIGTVKETLDTRMDNITKDWGVTITNMTSLWEEKLGKKLDVSWFIIGMTVWFSITSGMFYLVWDEVKDSRMEMKSEINDVATVTNSLSVSLSELKGLLSANSQQLKDLELIKP
jgi:hypothetical protein